MRKQRVGKYTYWQIVESKRVNGKPRPFVLLHLGTAEQLLYKLKEGIYKKKIKSYSHGAVYTLWKIAEEMEVINTCERHFAEQIREGLSVGKTLLLAAIHRALSPGSKRAFSVFATSTTLPEIAGFDPEKIDSQHFWDQMDTVTEQQMAAVEKDITAKMMEKGLLSSRLLFYDLANFFTYIATDNKRTKLAQRGKNKQKRNDLRQFGLAQVVTKEFLLPVLAQVYQGNKSENQLFIPLLTGLRQKLSELNINIEEITVVFDKGNNSKNNFKDLDKLKLSYVASLSSAYHEDLINIPLCYYRKVKVNGHELLCYRRKKEIWGKERTVVVYISERLREGQLRGLHHVMADKQKKLQELKESLQSGRSRKREKEDVKKKIATILQGERTELLLDVIIQENGKGRFDIDWEIEGLALRWMKESFFGKRILVSSQEDWTDEEIIGAYHGQSHIERVFKHFKNPYHHAVRPQYHWTDQKIKVHTFICLMGLLITQILWKKACELGCSLSLEKLLDKLTAIRKTEIITLTDLQGRPQKEVQLEDMEPDLQRLFEGLIGNSI